MRATQARLPHIPYLPLSHIFNRGLATQRSLPTKPHPTSARERGIGTLVPMPPLPLNYFSLQFRMHVYLWKSEYWALFPHTRYNELSFFTDKGFLIQNVAGIMKKTL